MKLIKAEHYEKGIWYFTSKYKVAEWLDIKQSLLEYYIRVNKPYKGWSFETIDGGDIMCKYINPERL